MNGVIREGTATGNTGDRTRAVLAELHHRFVRRGAIGSVVSDDDVDRDWETDDRGNTLLNSAGGNTLRRQSHTRRRLHRVVAMGAGGAQRRVVIRTCDRPPP